MVLIRRIRHYFEIRQRRRVARDLDRILWMLNSSHDLRRLVRKTLRVKAYEQ